MCVELLAGERGASETEKAVQACNDYLRLGVGRSLSKLAAHYNEAYKKESPTKSQSTLGKWSMDYNWQARCAIYDAEWDTKKTAARNATFAQGLALDFERVEKLKRLADFLEAQLYETSEDGIYYNVWVPDVKQIGSGEDVERVDIERFNGPLIAEYRSVLDDLAKEVGGRIKRGELSGPGGGPLLGVLIDRVQDAKRELDID